MHVLLIRFNVPADACASCTILNMNFETLLNGEASILLKRFDLMKCQTFEVLFSNAIPETF